MFITTIYKHSRKVKVNRNYVSKCNLYLHFLIWQNLLISSEKMVMSPEIKGCVTWFIYFLDLLWGRYNCAKFHHCTICGTDFREGGAFLPPPLHPWAAPKKPILKISLMENFIFCAVTLHPSVLRMFCNDCNVTNIKNSINDNLKIIPTWLY